MSTNNTKTEDLFSTAKIVEHVKTQCAASQAAALLNKFKEEVK